MDVIIVYSLSYACSIGLFILWIIYQLLTIKARERLLATFYKWTIYTLVARRHRASSDINILTAIVIAIYMIGNIVVSIIMVRNRAELTARLGTLCIVNLVMLFTGGRVSFIIDKVLRLSMTEYHLYHRWVGRVSLVQGLVHGALKMVEKKNGRGMRPLDLLVSVKFRAISF